jgi:hypothetical protein
MADRAQAEPKYDWRYWEPATRKSLEDRWGVDSAVLTDDDRRDLAYYRTLVAFYDDAPENLEIRREVQQAYVRGIMAEEEITRTNRIMPIDSRLSKVLANVCTLYSYPPNRTFSDVPEVSKRLSDIYRRGRADLVMAEAHELARLTGLVAVRPRFDRKGKKLLFQSWTPDRFRIRPHAEDSTEIGEMFYPFKVAVADKRFKSGFRSEIRIRYWTETETWVTDKRGEEILGERRPNRYGRIPFTFLRLRDARDGGLYGPGWWSLVAFQIWDNLTKLANDRNHLFNSFVVALAVNLGLKGDLQLGAGRVIVLENLKSSKDMPGSPVDPSLTTLDLQSNFTMGEQFRIDRKKELLRDNHLPAFYWDEAGQPPSGVSLRVQERELRRQERKDRPGLQDAEIDTADLTATVWNRDYFDDDGVQVARPTAEQLPEALEAFAIDYEEEPVYLEPKDQYELEKQQVKDGVRSVGRFYRDWSGDDVVDEKDENVAAAMAKRRAVAALALTGDAPAETPTPPTEEPVAPAAEEIEVETMVEGE